MSGSASELETDNVNSRLVLAAAALIALVVSLAIEEFSIKSVAVAMVAAIGAVILVSPFEHAIKALFLYESFEGFAKIVSNYHPVVHIGSDMIIAALSFRWFLTFLLQRTRIPATRPPFGTLFAIYFGWLLIEFFNPYSLGIMASLVGLKSYFNTMLLYLFGFYLAKDIRRIHSFMGVWIVSGMAQVVTGLYQGYLGQVSVTAISANYTRAMQMIIHDKAAFRPFGLTAVPGAAAVFMFLITPLIFYFLYRSRSTWIRVLLAVCTPGVALLLLLCQVRSALLKTLFGTLAFTLLVGLRASSATRKRLFIATPVVIAILAYGLPQLTAAWVEGSGENARGIARSMTLFEFDKVKGAREGADTQIARAATIAPLGAGLSWTGPAGGLFADQIAGNPHFPGGFWSDNFWATTIFEMGIPGSALFTLLLFAILIRGLKMQASLRSPDLRLVGGALLASLSSIVLGLWGAQGILFNPEASFFWFFAGVLMRLENLDRQGAPESLSHEASVTIRPSIA